MDDHNEPAQSPHPLYLCDFENPPQFIPLMDVFDGAGWPYKLPTKDARQIMLCALQARAPCCCDFLHDIYSECLQHGVSSHVTLARYAYNDWVVICHCCINDNEVRLHQLMYRLRLYHVFWLSKILPRDLVLEVMARLPQGLALMVVEHE